ncbi:MAG TPA: hypothetical protein VF185_02655 [Patescibacteria group bacterium]
MSIEHGVQKILGRFLSESSGPVPTLRPDPEPREWVRFNPTINEKTGQLEVHGGWEIKNGSRTVSVYTNGRVEVTREDKGCIALEDSGGLGIVQKYLSSDSLDEVRDLIRNLNVSSEMVEINGGQYLYYPLEN